MKNIHKAIFNVNSQCCNITNDLINKNTMEKINVAELLENCPKGMELDCTMFNDVVFNTVDFGKTIIVTRTNGTDIHLDKYGTYSNGKDAKCVIFPKGKTTWKGFKRPFVDGDVLSYQFPGFKNRSIYIYRNHPAMNTSYYVALSGDSNFMVSYGEGCALNGNNDTARIATEEEKEKLFQAIKYHGYKWNPKTKTLEKFQKFKVEDRIIFKYYDRGVAKIVGISDSEYKLDNGKTIPFQDENAYEISNEKFDITTFKPFDKVLVRDTKEQVWVADLFSHTVNRPLERCSFTCVGHYTNQCIPYKGNEHLLGTTNDCDEHFKTWK